MHKILHRINSKELLMKTPFEFGVEVDIRSNNNKLIMHHDPFQEGELFEEWLSFYKHGTLILNVKEEGLEDSLLKLMKRNNINNFFFLDQSFPFLRKTALSGEKRCAVRISEYEHIKTALSLSGLIEWAWIDCFTDFPLNSKDQKLLKDAGFKLCIVSPELQGRKDRNHVLEFQSKLESLDIFGDAVCTKYPDLWN